MTLLVFFIIFSDIPKKYTSYILFEIAFLHVFLLVSSSAVHSFFLISPLSVDERDLQKIIENFKCKTTSKFFLLLSNRIFFSLNFLLHRKVIPGHQQMVILVKQWQRNCYFSCRLRKETFMKDVGRILNRTKDILPFANQHLYRKFP